MIHIVERLEDRTLLSMDNVAPAIIGAHTAVAPDDCNTTTAGHINFTDPDFESHLVTIDWGDGSDPDGDLVVGENVSAGGGEATTGEVSVSVTGLHTYAAFGTYSIKATVTDSNGASSAQTTVGTVTVGATAAVVADPVWGTTLDIHGTDLADVITVNQNGGGSQIVVHSNSGPDMVFAADGISMIRLHLCGGDDHATVSSGVIPGVLIFGEGGNDHINAGKAAAIVLGGGGDDDLVGGAGVDLLIGGSGSDHLVGSAGDDILIAGYTAYDRDIDGQNIGNERALKAILGAWNTDGSYASRVAAVQNTNAAYNLLVNIATTGTGNRRQTAFSDNVEDKLTGSSGSDLFFANLIADADDAATVLDEITSLSSTEIAKDTDLYVNVSEPTIAIRGVTNVEEGSDFTLTLNAGTNPVTSVTIHWGDAMSTTISAAALADAGGQVKHMYADGSTSYAITVDLTNESGTFLDQANPMSVQVDNVAPTIVISGASNVDEGSAYWLNIGAVTDPGVDTVVSYTIDWGDGSDPDGDDVVGETITAANLALAEGQLQHIYANGLNTYVIKVDVTDEDGTFVDRADYFSVQVDNVAPTLVIGGESPVDEGSLFTLTLGALTDPGTDTLTSFTVHWGDGFSDTYYDTDDVVSHVYAVGGTIYTITVDLTDEDDTFLNPNSLNVTVNDLEPPLL